jgi:hypothetical protein
MKGFQIFLSLVFIALFLISLVITSEPKTKPPNIYITRTDRVRTFEGSDLWIIEYTVNGVMQAAMFDSPEALAEYREYLDTIGRVYKGEGDNAAE